MLHVVDSTKPVDQLRADLTQACKDRGFGVLGVHDLREKLREKGVDYSGECLVFEVCNPEKARQVLEANPEISTALPCRISVYRGADGGTRLATLRPSLLMELFATPTLEGVADEVERTLVAIMEAAR